METNRPFQRCPVERTEGLTSVRWFRLRLLASVLFVFALPNKTANRNQEKDDSLKRFPDLQYDLPCTYQAGLSRPLPALGSLVGLNCLLFTYESIHANLATAYLVSHQCTAEKGVKFPMPHIGMVCSVGPVASCIQAALSHIFR